MRNSKADIGLLVLRVSVGLMMLLHGIAKLSHGIGFIYDSLSSIGIGFVAYGVYVGEVLAPVLLIIGFRTKLAAAIIAFTMVVAVLMAHAAQIFSLSQTGGWEIELQGLYFFASLGLFFLGGGNLAVSKSNSWD